MKSEELSLLSTILTELGDECCACTTRDLGTITRRTKTEGASFLTITLPTFAAGLERGLARGCVTLADFPGFRGRGCLPAFLQGFTSQVFDQGTGILLDTPSIEAIRAVRQLTLMFGKVNLACTPAREARAIAKYVEIEQEIRQIDATYSPELLGEFTRVAEILFGDVFAEVERKLALGLDIPKHGPGSTQDGLLGNSKYGLRTWTDRLQEFFPFEEYLLPNARYLVSSDPVTFLAPRDEPPVKVVLVPKTLKTPRVIAMEPTHTQYVQQGIMEMLVEELESRDSLVGFTDQAPNQVLARKGSLDGSIATLDLSEASDRVSNLLVQALFGYRPYLSGAVQACRSLRADIPGFGVQTLAKYASMGSALCFPVEAMVFATAAMMGIASSQDVRVSKAVRKRLAGTVRVYGDDIIVPSHSAVAVVESLETFGFKVNNRKSFWTGKFRESCGKEYYDGHDVTVVRYRRTWPKSLRDVAGVVSLTSFRNQCYMAGLWKTARWLDARLEKLLGVYPTVNPTSPAIGRHTVLPVEGDMVCPHLQRDLVWSYVASEVLPRNTVEGQDALLKWFLKRGDKPLQRDHAERSGRPVVVSMKRQRVTPY